MAYPCPKDPTHLSTDPDYCSECGAKIAAQTAPAQTASAPAASASSPDAVCPDCGTRRSGAAKFCEVCRYNFDTGTSSGAAPASPPVTPAPPPAAIAPVIPNFPTRKFDAVATVDPSLNTYPDPSLPIPVGEPEHVFPLDLPENLIGRRSESRGIYPEVSLKDPGVSGRHAKLLVENDAVQLLELGSTNGTRLNGVEVQAGVKTALNVGDVVTLGCWTRIEIRER